MASSEAPSPARVAVRVASVAVDFTWSRFLKEKEREREASREKKRVGEREIDFGRVRERDELARGGTVATRVPPK